MKMNPYIALHTKINSKWVKDLNVRPKTILLETSTGQKPSDIRFDNDFLDITTKTQVAKETNRKIAFMEIF